MRPVIALLICLTSAAPVFAGTCVELGDSGFMIALDGPFVIAERGTMTVLTLEPQSRAPRTVTIDTNAGVVSSGQVTILDNGMILNFSTTTTEAFGSGGGAAYLEGLLGQGPFVEVSCTMQAEDPDPTWCLPILAKLGTFPTACK